MYLYLWNTRPATRETISPRHSRRILRDEHALLSKNVGLGKNLAYVGSSFRIISLSLGTHGV